MLARIAIKDFKSIVEADLELGRVNMFIGGNGAGKSNVLEAIGVVSAAVGRGLTDNDFLQKGVRLTPPELMHSAFREIEPSDDQFRLSVELFGNVTYDANLATGTVGLRLLSERCQFRDSVTFERTPESARFLETVVPPSLLEADRGMWDQVKAILEPHKHVRHALDSLAKYAIYSPQAHFLRGQVGVTPSASPVGLHGEGLPEAVSGVIDQAHGLKEKKGEEWNLKWQALQLAFLPGWANQIQVGPISDKVVSKAVVSSSADKKGDTLYFVDKFMEEESSKLSAYDSSEGTLFLLFAATLLAHDKSPRIFAFDNADDALNPKMTRGLLETIIKLTIRSSEKKLHCGPRQVFLTSHNPTALDAFDLFDPDQRVFVVSRDPFGHTKITRLEPPKGTTREEWAELKGGLNLSQLWIDGAIDGALGL